MPKYKKEDYKYKTEPFDHQDIVFKLSRDREDFALLMEMGTGKTKVIIDTAAWLYARGKIEAVMVIAPNGVHSNWEGEIDIHLPDWVKRTVRIYSSRGNTKKYKKYMSALGTGDDLKIMLMNVEAMATKKGQAYASKFTRIYSCLTVVDESTRIKNPKAIRTKACIKAGRASSYKRILTGTPVTQSPLDLYSQFDFLGDDILGFSSYFAFKARYAITMRRTNKRGGKTWFYDEIIDFCNLDELTEKIDPYSYRVTKKECLDLPNKQYSQVRVTMSKDQKKIYEDMKASFRAELDEGVTITAPLALTRLLRLQQILGGFVNDEFSETHVIPGKNPKLDALMYDLEDVPDDVSVGIWARFRAEIECITDKLKEVYGKGSAASYYGGVKTEDRMKIIERFQAGDLRFFVGSPAAGAHGITLTKGSLVYYFSNDFSLENRIQSEDRFHRIGQVNKVNYKDIVVPGTIDIHVLSAHKKKQGFADTVTGDLSTYKEIINDLS